MRTRLIILGYIFFSIGSLAIAQESPRSPFREPLGAEDIREMEKRQSDPGFIPGCVEKNPPEWAVPFLRGETDRIDFPEPVYTSDLDRLPTQ
jgi:hypothetical protein